MNVSRHETRSDLRCGEQYDLNVRQALKARRIAPRSADLLQPEARPGEIGLGLLLKTALGRNSEAKSGHDEAPASSRSMRTAAPMA